jgi:hypothetical protein
MYLKNDTTGDIAEFAKPQTGWSAATQEEIDAYLLSGAKVDKINQLKLDLSDFCEAGYVYLTWSFCLSDESTNNITLKDLAPAGMPDRYKYFDMSNTQRDFTDASGFTAFKDAIFTEKDRIMVKYNNYKSQINACSTVAEVDAITISFSA